MFLPWKKFARRVADRTASHVIFGTLRQTGDLFRCRHTSSNSGVMEIASPTSAALLYLTLQLRIVTLAQSPANSCGVGKRLRGIGVSKSTGMAKDPCAISFLPASIRHSIICGPQRGLWWRASTLQSARLRNEIYSAKLVMGDSPALVAGSRGKPYLITRNGEITVRSLDQV